MSEQTRKITAGRAAEEGKWDFRKLVPSDVSNKGDIRPFLKESLLHADITRKEEKIAQLLIEGYGVRRASRESGLHRVEIQKIQRKVQEGLKKLLESKPIWSPQKCFREEILDKVKMCKRLAKQRASRIRLEADAKGCTGAQKKNVGRRV